MPSLNYAKFEALYDSDEDREKAKKQSEQTERARTYAERRQKAAAAAAAAGPAALAASLSPAEDKVTVMAFTAATHLCTSMRAHSSQSSVLQAAEPATSSV
jgi:hypothetical protein